MKSSNTPWLAALFVAILNLAVLLAQLSAHNQDPSYFISIGDRFVVRPDDLPPNLHILLASPGYDGQFYYQLALNPFGPQEVNAGLSIDNGPYRHQRIFYPLLVWLCSFGNRNFIPAMLVIVNYLTLCALAWLGGRYAQLHHRHALWGSLFGLYPGFLFTLTHDLAEILVGVFLLAGVLSLQRSSPSMCSGICLTLAVLTKETALLAVLALGIASIAQKASSHRLTVMMPLVTYGLWQTMLWTKWGQLPVLAGRGNLGLPGGGIITLLSSLQVGNLTHGIWIVELIEVMVIALAATVALYTTKDLVPYKLMWLGYGLLLILLSRQIWVEDLAFMRAITEFYLLGLVLIIASERLSLLTPIVTITLTTWVLVFFTRLDW